jgi:hypothetical protein
MKIGAERGKLVTLLDEPYLAFFVSLLTLATLSPGHWGEGLFMSF